MSWQGLSLFLGYYGNKEFLEINFQEFQEFRACVVGEINELGEIEIYRGKHYILRGS